MKKIALIFILLCVAPFAQADVMDDYSDLQMRWEEMLLDSLGQHFDGSNWNALRKKTQQFASHFSDAETRRAWTQAAAATWDRAEPSSIILAQHCAQWQARLQQSAALEMLAHQAAGEIEPAKAWRALIQLPRHASAVEGALALQRLGARESDRGAISELLAKEFVSWETTRIREKLDALKRTIAAGRASPELVAAHLTEINALSNFPNHVLHLAKSSVSAPPKLEIDPLVQLAAEKNWTGVLAHFGTMRAQIESGLPNLLTAQEVVRRERLLLKLIQLVPKEYQAAVRDGQIVVPIEYRHAQAFLVQAQQLVDELSASWRSKHAEAFAKSDGKLREQLETQERIISEKASLETLEASVKGTLALLENEFGLSTQRFGNLVDEAVLDVRAALGRSLAAAQTGRWAEAESARLDAYTSFDLEIERRVLPRAPQLALAAERSFLEDIKTALDGRFRGAALEERYQAPLAYLDECAALLKVSVSPATITFTTATVVMREGLEAVVILTALLAGMRGVEQRRQRKGIVTGAWVAIAVTGLTFWASRTIIKSLSHYGEIVEAVVSILAVAILLMVTNWVFHKFYWAGWNSKLRHLSRTVENSGSMRWEWIGFVGVGFLTIFREGFETTLFMQSLILEGGPKAVAVGFGIGALFIAAIGWAIFGIGTRLPYRKMLVITGILVVSILVTFLGSTVRLFQTVGWMPIHPITWLHIPYWVGLWFGIYPSWEGVIIPPAGLGYVGGAWLFTKWKARATAKSTVVEKDDLPTPTPSFIATGLTN